MILAILGVGTMGEALLAGLIQAGWHKDNLRAADSRPLVRKQVARTHGVWDGTALHAVVGADVVIIAVKPQDIPELLREVGPVLASEALVISLAAGVSNQTLESLLPFERPVVRAMPNTPALVGAGMSAISAGSFATPEHVTRAEEILSAVGKVAVVPEKYMDAVTAVSGSGPAYIMYVAEAMIDAGVMLGLPRPVATDLAKQTLIGSAKLLVDSGEHPTVLKERVTSPGGTTAAALRTFEDHGVKAGFLAAMEAAYKRSKELGQT